MLTMCFITVRSLLPAVFFFSVGAFQFSMPIVIYLPSSSLRPSRPPLGQARSFPGALVNAIYQHPIATAVFCGSAYLLLIRRQELSERLLVVGTSLKDYLSNAFGSLVSSTRPITKDPFFGSSAKGTSSEKTMPESPPKPVDPNSIEGLEVELKSNAVDPNSFAKPDEAKVSHLHLQIGVDFDKHILNGNVILTVNRVAKTASKLLLDTFELSISEVQLLSDDGKSPLQWTLHKAVPEFGSKLEVDLSLASGASCKVQIDYQTSATARALQWLTPEQTEGGMHPFMFSQCQAINARSMVPCQDTPAVKATYTAEIEAPQHAKVLMSAKISKEPSKSANNNSQRQVHHFEQSVPIPSYLIAIVAGDLVSQKLGPRSHVWAERALIKKAAWEFEEVEKILKIAEEIAGPYEFGIYDLLILPPSFPFGGMENPCLTFITPTLLAGDRSLVNVVAHEIAHSWSGNSVTNANFEHFWLNEGFTKFIERKIIGKMGQGEKARHFSALEGIKELKETLDAMGATNPLTQLVTDLRGINPDNAFSIVPYEKGHTFLLYLEILLGGPSVFDPFLRSYLQHFKNKSIKTEDFKKYLIDYFFKNGTPETSLILTEVDWNGWLKTPGDPLVTPKLDTTLLKVCIDLAKKWIEVPDDQLKSGNGPFTADEFKAFTSGQKKLFLMELDERTEGKRLSAGKLERLTELYQLRSEHNAEVSSKWIILGLKSQWKGVAQDATKFVTEIGRMKFIRPIYRAMFQWAETKQMALDTFKANKDRMMSVAVAAISTELNLK